MPKMAPDCLPLNEMVLLQMRRLTVHVCLYVGALFAHLGKLSWAYDAILILSLTSNVQAENDKSNNIKVKFQCQKRQQNSLKHSMCLARRKCGQNATEQNDRNDDLL